MSRRYGRNQKRHHRERIAELEELVRQGRVIRDFISVERDRLARKLREQENHVREIADTINDIVTNSALLPATPSPVPLDRRFQPQRLRVVRRRRVPFPISGEITRDALDLGIVELDLWELRATLEDNLTTFQHLVHVTAPEGKHTAYWISGDAFRHFASRGRLPELAREIFRQILRALDERAEKRAG